MTAKSNFRSLKEHTSPKRLKKMCEDKLGSFQSELNVCAISNARS